MKYIILFMLLIFAVFGSLASDNIVPRTAHTKYVGTLGKPYMGVHADSLNGIAIGSYISEKDSATKYIPYWQFGKFFPFSDTASANGFYNRPYTDALLVVKYNKADTSSATLGFYPRQQIDALNSANYKKADTASATLGFYPRQQIDAIIAGLSTGGIASLNGLSGASQTFALDTTISGAPAWSSATTVHTLQLPFLRFLKKSDFPNITDTSKYVEIKDSTVYLPYWQRGIFAVRADSNTTKNPITLSYAFNNFAPIASPTFTGTVTIPTGLTGTVRATAGVLSATGSDSVGLGVNLYGKVSVSDSSSTPSGRGKFVTPSMLATKRSTGDSSATAGTPGVYYTPTMMANYTRTKSFVLVSPALAYAVDHEFCIMAKTEAAIVITNLEVTCDADPTTELTGDLKWADAFIGLGNATVINDFDTGTGTRSDASIAAGAVAAGKCIYISFDTTPDAAMTQVAFTISYHY